jgi:hypothetical protein
MYEYNQLLKRYGVSTPMLDYAGTEMPTDIADPEYNAMLEKYNVDRAEYDEWLNEYKRRRAAFNMYGPDFQGELLGTPKYTYGYDYVDPEAEALTTESTLPTVEPVTATELSPVTIYGSGDSYSGQSSAPEASRGAGWGVPTNMNFSLDRAMQYAQENPIATTLGMVAAPAPTLARLGWAGFANDMEDAPPTSPMGLRSAELSAEANAMAEADRVSSLDSMQQALADDTRDLNGLSGGYGGGISNGEGGDRTSTDSSGRGTNADGNDGWAKGGLVGLHNKYAKGGTVRKFSFGGVAEDPAVAHSPGYVGGGQTLSPELRAAILQDARANGVTDPSTAFTGGSSYGYSPAPQQSSPAPQVVPSQAAEELNYAAEMRAARQENKAAQDQLNQMLRQAMEQKSEPPSKAELYFQLAAAFAAPTKTGSFGESMGEASKVLGEHQKAIRAGSSADRAARMQIGLEMAKQRMLGSKEDITNLRALTVEEMKARRMQMEPKSEVGKQALDEGLQPGTPQFVSRVAGTNTENQGLKISTDQLKKDAAQLALEREQRAKLQASKLTPPELKLKEETEDAIASGNQALQALNKALIINPKTFTGSLGDMAQKYALGVVNPNHPQIQATEELENLLGNQALASLKTLVGGNPTEGERKVIMDLQGISSKSIPVRKGIIENTIKATESRIARNKQRLQEVSSGAYRETTPTVEGVQ